MSEHRRNIKLKLSNSLAQLPTQEKGDLGWDLYSTESGWVMPKYPKTFNTGLQFAQNPVFDYNRNGAPLWALGFLIFGRSGLANKGITPEGGVVDPSYRGDIKVCLHNNSTERYWVEAGDKIAQALLVPVLANTEHSSVEFIAVDWQDNTNRGDRGFGSSGR